MLRWVLSREGLHKLSPMWEGPFKVVHVSRPGSVRLETPEGVPIQNAWNIQHLRRFYPCEAAAFWKRPGACEEGECL